MTTIVAIANEKGGVAKTTSTLSLGAALAELGHKILLIDLDPQANLTLALGYEPGEAAKTSANVLIEVPPCKTPSTPPKSSGWTSSPAMGEWKAPNNIYRSAPIIW